MNKKIRFICAMVVSICLFMSMLSLTSCEIDTLPEPDGIISGSIRDAINPGNTFWTEQPNGFQIGCSETSWKGSETVGGQTFWGKADGTFYNCRIFAATYDIYPTNGAFHSYKAQTVEIKSGQETKLVFDVIPYCSFHDASITKDPNNAGTVIVKFKVTTNPVADNPATTDVDETVPATIRNWRLFASASTPYVGSNIGTNDTEVSTASDQPLTESQLGTEITYSKSGFKAGTTYYLRLGVRCIESTADRYNMTEIVKIEF